MLSWARILLGGLLTLAVTAVFFVALRKERRLAVLGPALTASLLGPISWNAVLHRVGGSAFDVDIPFKPFPISWQDAGSGVFTLALASVLFGRSLRREPAGKVLFLASLVAAIALIVDIYAY